MGRYISMWLMAVIGLVVAFGVGFLIRTAEIPTIEALENSGELCTPETPSLAENIDFLLEGTEYQHKWTLNDRPRTDTVNFYFFCPSFTRTIRSLQLYANNCAYVGRPNLVVCDARFLGGFVAASGISGEFPLTSDPTRQFRNAERDILIWVLGHEIGHILANDRPAHFQSNRLNDSITSSSLHWNKELFADAWFVRHLKLDGNMQRSVEVTLSQLLYAQVRRKVGNAHLYPGTGVPLPDQMIEYAKSGTHPEFVFRATRMLSLSYDRPGAIQFKRQVDDFANALR